MNKQVQDRQVNKQINKQMSNSLLHESKELFKGKVGLAVWGIPFLISQVVVVVVVIRRGVVPPETKARV